MEKFSKPNYGKKFVCFKCGCKFYDLQKKKALCPKCGIDQSEAPIIAASTKIQPTSMKGAKKKMPINEPEATEYEPIEVEADELKFSEEPAEKDEEDSEEEEI